MKNILLFLILIFGVWSFYVDHKVVSLGPGAKAIEEPTQREIDPPEQQTMGAYTVNEVARFDITAKVLAKSTYHFDRESDLSPVDLALGWGNMSDESILEHILDSHSKCKTSV